MILSWKIYVSCFWSEWPLFEIQIQNGYRQQTNKSVFMHVNYNIENNICLIEI